MLILRIKKLSLFIISIIYSLLKVFTLDGFRFFYLAKILIILFLLLLLLSIQSFLIISINNDNIFNN